MNIWGKHLNIEPNLTGWWHATQQFIHNYI